MKVWKKLAGLALALAVVMSLTVSAWATPVSLNNGGVAMDSTTPYDFAAIDNQLNITKAITVHGTQSSVYSPAVTYTYSIAPVEEDDLDDVDVTDSDENVGKVKEGPTAGVTLTDATAVFTSASTTLTSGTATVSDTITVNVVLSAFNVTAYGPGIYRYAITSDNDDVIADAGVTASGATTRDDRFLDVYIKNNDDGTALEVYGFVLLDTNAAITDEDNPSHKSAGFATDNYYTIDVTLTKSITGNAANKTHQFPFTITVSNNGLSYSYAKGSATLATGGATALTTTLADDEVFNIYGLNPLATVTYVETNDTPDTYLVTINDGNSTTPAVINDIEDESTAPDATQTTGALEISTYDADDLDEAPVANDNAAVTFINNLEAISPTGVVLRFAPYLAMLGAGFTTMVIAPRRKEEV